VVEESGPVFGATPVTLETDADASTDQATNPTVTRPATERPVEASPDASPADAVAPVTSPAPRPADPPVTGPGASSATPEIVTEYRGVFEGDAHPTAGDAIVLGNGTGQRFLRFENFQTDNGPDLNVYLVNSSTGGVSDYIDLGDLKGNVGDQNYEIPAGVDLSLYDTVVIWCVRFGVGFGDARLMTV